MHPVEPSTVPVDTFPALALLFSGWAWANVDWLCLCWCAISQLASLVSQLPLMVSQQWWGPAFSRAWKNMFWKTGQDAMRLEPPSLFSILIYLCAVKSHQHNGSNAHWLALRLDAFLKNTNYVSTQWPLKTTVCCSKCDYEKWHFQINCPCFL